MTVSLRISRTFGFGGEANRSASSSQPKGQGQAATNTADAKRGGDSRGGPTMGAMGGATRVGGGGGGGEGPRGGGGPQMMMMGGPGGASAPQKYSLTASVNFQNIFNRVNLSNPVGNLSSPFFGQSLGLAGSFGGFGGGGGGGSTGAGNRRIYLNLRFTF